MRPLRLALLGLALPFLAMGAARSQEVVLTADTVSLRLQGRIRSVAPDRKSLELDVVATTSDTGRQRISSVAVPRSVRLADVCYIFDAKDHSVFYDRQDLQPGKIATVLGIQRGDGILAQEVRLGGELPKPQPVAPDVAAGADIRDPNLVKLPPARRGPAKFEPPKGCYLGAFVVQDANVERRMDLWEQRVGKGHASYLTYCGYGRPFPEAWVNKVREVGAAPNIAFEPNDGLDRVRDNAYLRKWARAAAHSGGPLFLRFGSEMNGTWTAYNGNPTLYRAKFRLVARVMREEAPNVAMVWTPYCSPVNNIPSYYPGDDAVDWVGVNIYSVHHHNGRMDSPAMNEDPTALLRPIYNWYASRKPIQISEYASTNYCLACSQPMPDFAIAKMKRMYQSLPTRFPRVKMIYWFSWDTISGGAAENNYAVTADPAVLATYKKLTHTSYFLPRLQWSVASR